MSVAKEHGTTAHIFTSHSQDSKKNPLSGEHKVKLIKHAYPEAHVASSSKEIPSMLHVAKHLHEQGHKHLVMVAGSDRVKEYEDKLKQYNDPTAHFRMFREEIAKAADDGKTKLPCPHRK